MNEKKQLTGRIVFIYFLVFFGIIFVVNIFLVKLAVNSNPGVEVEHTYEKEMKFNKSQNE